MQNQTINPLHFEDLDPHRFEDLIRQLVYDFKDWSMLEATGRMGSEEGFDIRGWEKLPGDEDDLQYNSRISKNRIWLIQCKREKKISPKKMTKYLEDVLANKENLYGIIFTAPCDFSKRTRDAFITNVSEKGIIEFRLWGKAEIEDQLFQPKNDHLLFAYFGFSLAIKKRTMKTRIRARIATKQKLIKLFDEESKYRYEINPLVLLRNPDADYYPYDEEYSDFNINPQWLICNFEQFRYNGIIVTGLKYYAYINDNKKSYDSINKKNILVSSDPYLNNKLRIIPDDITENEARLEWEKIPSKNRGYCLVQGLIHYDEIIAIDEKGDELHEGIHIYANWEPNSLFFYYIYASIYDENMKKLFEDFESERKIKYFSKKFTRQSSKKND